MLDDVGQLPCREPYVHRDQDGAGHGNAIVQLQHHVAVHAQRGHAVAGLDARICQKSRQPMGPVAEFAIGEAPLTIDDGGAMGKYGRGAFQKQGRAERTFREVGHAPSKKVGRAKPISCRLRAASWARTLGI